MAEWEIRLKRGDPEDHASVRELGWNQSGLWTEWHFLQSAAAFQVASAFGVLDSSATAARFNSAVLADQLAMSPLGGVLRANCWVR